MSVPTPTIKWEYKVVLTRSGIEKDIEDALNKTGADGWELAGGENSYSLCSWMLAGSLSI
jgi:hypothetical protein